jgi:4-amino-4-deoxy-L-arabinose transferase-like glycosyltransferase
MRFPLKALLAFVATFAVLILLHLPLLRLPYFWDEAGYYIPSALDFYRSWSLTPHTTLPEGHPPLVMIYLGLAWRLFGYSAWVARAAMTLISTATVASLYVLARRIANPEIAAWSALLLALSPLFFAQSTLAHLDLAAALFTTLAVLFLLANQFWLYALAASLAVLSKETSVVLLPVVWLYAGRITRRYLAESRVTLLFWAPLVAPIVPLAAWALFYHHATGFWTGNRGYLSYNLYSTLSPVRVFWSFTRRAYELFFAGFNWLLTLCAPVGIWWGRKYSKLDPVRLEEGPPWRPFIFLTAGLVAVYLLLLSLVGGAILPRYLLPVMPLFYLAIIAMVIRLPHFAGRLVLSAVAVCFVGGWFINPPYPFPFEDNLAYADFIRLHEQAAHFLESQPDQPRILTAWPATDELARPFLGYVHNPLRVVPVQGFAGRELADVPPESFDLLYLYSRRWEPPGNWLERYPAWLRMQGRYFDYQPQTDAQAVAARYHLRLVAQMERRGQWVQIYSH